MLYNRFIEVMNVFRSKMEMKFTLKGVGGE